MPESASLLPFFLASLPTLSVSIYPTPFMKPTVRAVDLGESESIPETTIVGGLIVC